MLTLLRNVKDILPGFESIPDCKRSAALETEAEVDGLGEILLNGAEDISPSKKTFRTN